MKRYKRHIVLSEIGIEGQKKLLSAKVLVIGAGGLGCPVLQYLTAAGVGTIGIIDFDAVSESNLHRQILFGDSSLGKNKAIAAKQRLEDLNSSITIQAYPEKLSYNNALSLFSVYDIIVDGTDNFETRYLINDASLITNKPLVYGGVFKFEGQVSVFNYNNGPSYRCLFPNPPKKDTIPNCSEIGVLGVLPGIIGSLQATEVIKIILGLGDSLSGKVLFYNSLTTKMSTIFLNRSDSEINKVLRNKGLFHLGSNNNQVDLNEQFSVQELSINDLINDDDIQFIDVREPHELPKVSILDPTYIPLSEIEHHLERIQSEKKKAIFCQMGIRSKIAVSILNRHDIKNCISIKEGASEIVIYLKKNV